MIGVLVTAFVLEPVLACGHSEAYRRLRTLLALGLVGLLLGLMLALAVRLPLTEMLTLLSLP